MEIINAATVINRNNVNMLFITIPIPSTSRTNYFNDVDEHHETILFYRGDELNILFPRHKNDTRFTIGNISENSITTTTSDEPIYLKDIKGAKLILNDDYGGKRRTKRRTKRKNRRNKSRKNRRNRSRKNRRNKSRKK
jgi:hypothetical protein